jgi:hypothetical protein
VRNREPHISRASANVSDSSSDASTVLRYEGLRVRGPRLRPSEAGQTHGCGHTALSLRFRLLVDCQDLLELSAGLLDSQVGPNHISMHIPCSCSLYGDAAVDTPEIRLVTPLGGAASSTSAIATLILFLR